MSTWVLISLYYLVLVQGGFYGRTYIPATVIFFIGAGVNFHNQRKQGQSLTNLFAGKSVKDYMGIVLLIMLTITYGITECIHQATLSDYGRVVYVLGILFLILLTKSITQQQSLIIRKGLVCLGVVESVVALLCFLGIEMRDVLRNARFMGTFQYANATAFFLDMMLLLLFVDLQETVNDRNTKNKKASTAKGRKSNVIEMQSEHYGIALLLSTMLVTTFSAGGMTCYILALLVWWMVLKSKRSIYAGMIFILSGVFAGLLYVAKFRLESVPAVIVAVVILLGCCIFFECCRDKVISILESFGCKIFIAFLFICELICGVMLFGHRVYGTGMERLEQMWDGIDILRHNLLVGVGVSGLMDELLNRGVEYKTSLVHNSFLQVGVEAGIVAMLVVIALFVLLGIVLRKKQASIMQWLIFCIGILHFFTDVSMFFGGVFYVWIFLLISEER